MKSPNYYTYRPIPCDDITRYILASGTVNMPLIGAYYLGNMIKYLYRFNHKDGIRDIDKLSDYTSKFINVMQNAKDPYSYQWSIHAAGGFGDIDEYGCIIRRFLTDLCNCNYVYAVRDISTLRDTFIESANDRAR